jgi:hypothetical protein
MSKAWEKGSTRAWRRVRARVLSRDGYRCQLRLPGCTDVATCVHHKLGKNVSDRDEDCCAACVSCNNTIGDPRTAGDLAPRPSTKW